MRLIMLPAEAPSPPEANRDDTVADTFPASDPAPAAVVQGTRLVDLAELRPAATAPPADATVMTRQFTDGEAAKLALEGIVRDGPFDRRQGEITEAGDGVRLALRVATDDAERLRGLLDR